MFHQRRFYNTLLLIGIVSCLPLSIKPRACAKFGPLEYVFKGLFRPETFAGRNNTLLNDNNCDLDKVWLARHTLDLSLGVTYDSPLDPSCPVVDFFMELRNKAVWGNPGSVASTNEETLKIGEAVLGAHKHTIPRHIFWMREGWLRIDIGQAIGLCGLKGHNFRLGAFPFQLGRGISLGSAFAVGSELLGFYTDVLVDQFAFGAKFSGPFITEHTTYDLYASVWDNKSGSIADTGAKVRAQQYGRIETPARGFGQINYIIAGRLQWNIFNRPGWGRLCVEPYALYNRQPEQKIEFRGAAESRLSTIGMALDYSNGPGEFNIEAAVNIGRQRVRGWDRNQVSVATIPNTGVLQTQNSHVQDQNGAKIPFIAGSAAQKLIQNTLQDESENGKKIATVSLVDPLTGATVSKDLINSDNRFKNPYSNSYDGWMFVADGCYQLSCFDMKLCASFGIASGDQNPNEEEVDGRYEGFISLQEVYAGRCVRSTFLLGAGRPKRPLTQRNQNRQKGRFSSTVSGFTNLVYAGLAAQWRPHCLTNELKFHPNILFYWQEDPGKKFDVATGQDLESRASAFLGVELNLFAHYYLY